MLEGPRRLISGLARKIAPAPATWRGATWGALLATFVLWLVEAGPRIAGASDNLGAWLGILTATVAITLAGLFASLLVRWLGALPPRYRWIVATAVLLALAMNEIASVTLGGMTIVTASAIVLGSVAGGSLAVWLRNRRQWVALASLVVASMALAIGIRWMFVEGNAPYVATQLPAGVAPLDRPDPSQPGSYAVKTLTYGSGADRWRPEFGAAVGEMFRTESIDGSKLVEQWSGAAGWARTRYWGFDAKHMPLQARVWYPEGAGPFPLVIIVHGNHNMEDYSDPGYAYLGELMASRGFIVASLDENFINSSVGSDLLGFPNISIKKETDARAWLLLEHLRVWRAWNAREGHPFFRRVDMSQIAIMGHSRGGEAVAVAAAFNRLPYYPDDAHIRFDYDFDIRTVIAIAPVDGQYKPDAPPSPTM